LGHVRPSLDLLGALGRGTDDPLDQAVLDIVIYPEVKLRLSQTDRRFRRPRQPLQCPHGYALARPRRRAAVSRGARAAVSGAGASLTSVTTSAASSRSPRSASTSINSPGSRR